MQKERVQWKVDGTGFPKIQGTSYSTRCYRNIGVFKIFLKIDWDALALVALDKSFHLVERHERVKYSFSFQETRCGSFAFN